MRLNPNQSDATRAASLAAAIAVQRVAGGLLSQPRAAQVARQAAAAALKQLAAGSRA